MTKENIINLNATNLDNIQNKFVITYYANKHGKFITRNGSWFKPDTDTVGKAFVSKNGKVCFVYWDLDQNGWRMATELMTIKAERKARYTL